MDWTTSDGWASLLSYVDGRCGLLRFSNVLNMCYISVSMDVNGAVIQERERECVCACMRAVLLEV